jgi:flagellar hook protein FlgE
MSFSIALSGLNAATSDLNVTANNIANANTTGFKTSRAEFGDVYSAASSGVVSSNIIGAGVRTTRIAQQFTQGSIEFTNNSLDIALSGEGFFTLSQNGATQYTRNGAFSTDADGYIVAQSGARVQVFPSIGGNLFDNSRLTDLQLQAGDNPPQATTSVSTLYNLPANASPPAVAVFDPTDPASYNHTTSATIYDSLGAAHPANLYFVKDAAANTWNAHVAIDGTEVGTGTQLVYSSAGVLTTPAGGQITLPAYATTNGSAALNLTVSLGDSTQFGSAFSVSDVSQDGYASGRLSGVAITQDGVVQARYTNGQATPLGQIALTSFPNPQGLQQAGDTNWTETFQSGQSQRGAAGSSNFGLLQSGALEASNVDLTAQLVNMITAQRNFQASAQVIQTNDQITQTIINIR